MFRKRHQKTQSVQLHRSLSTNEEKAGEKGEEGKGEEEGEEDGHSLLLEAVELKRLRTLERRLGLRKDGKRVRRVGKKGTDGADGERTRGNGEDGDEEDGEDGGRAGEDSLYGSGGGAHEKYELESTFTMERQKSELEKKRQEYIDKSLVELGLKSSDSIHLKEEKQEEEEGVKEEDGEEEKEASRLGRRGADLYRIPMHLKVVRIRQEEDEQRVDGKRSGKRGEEVHGLDDVMDEDDEFGEGKLQGMTGLVQVELPLSERVKMMERTEKAKRKLEAAHERRYERRSGSEPGDGKDGKDGNGWKRDAGNGIGVDLDGIATSVDAVKHFVHNRGRYVRQLHDEVEDKEEREKDVEPGKEKGQERRDVRRRFVGAKHGLRPELATDYLARERYKKKFKFR